MTVQQRHQKLSGYTLVEVLVSLVVLSIGLLGMANMQLVTLRNSSGSYLRSQASAYAQDIADRMHANYKGNVVTQGNPGGYYWLNLGSVPANPGATNCQTGPCNYQQLAAEDMYQWYTAAQGSLPGFEASITCSLPSPQNFPPTCAALAVETITIMWNEPGQTTATGTGCSGNPLVDKYCYTLDVGLGTQ